MIAPSRNLLRTLSLLQLLVAGWVWSKDTGVAMVFAFISAGLWLASLPPKRTRR